MTYTIEELEALAAAAGVEWDVIDDTNHRNLNIHHPNKYIAYFVGHTEQSYGDTKQEAMNHYWNRYINGEIRRYIR